MSARSSASKACSFCQLATSCRSSRLSLFFSNSLICSFVSIRQCISQRYLCQAVVFASKHFPVNVTLMNTKTTKKTEKPETTTKRRMKVFRLTPEACDKLAAASAALGVSEAAYIELLLRNRLRRDGVE